MNPEGILTAPYMARFQDTEDDLPMDRNAIWNLAAWPELTHLYALAEICAGRPDLALEAVSKNLPEKAHAENPFAAPFYYPEKYIPPLNVPWLCTWAGDPTLIQVLLEGFFGIKAGLNGLTIEPHLPGAWTGDQLLRARFCYRGAQWEVSIHPSAPASGDTFLRKL